MHKTKRSRTEIMPGIKAASFDSLGLSKNKRRNDRRRRGDEACRRRQLLHWLEEIDAVLEADEQWRIAKRCQAATREIANRQPSRDGTSRMNREVGADQRSHHDHGGASTMPVKSIPALPTELPDGMRCPPTLARFDKTLAPKSSS